jgi:acetyltransferase-like isoleucine patch superfamily enzyme
MVIIAAMAGGILTVTQEFLDTLYRRTILLRVNSPAPADGSYGWLNAGQQLRLYGEVRIEQNAGLYGGPYRPMLGGRHASGLCSVGAFSYSYSALPEGIRVGRYCSISRGLQFIDSFHPTDRLTTSALLFRPKNRLYGPTRTAATREFAEGFTIQGSRPYPVIGHDVWIGAGVTLAMGIRIGHGAVVAANSTVTKDVPAYAVVAGNPARVVKMRFDDDLVGRLLTTRWWDYDPAQVFETTDPEEAVGRIEDGKVDPFEFAAIDVGPDANPGVTPDADADRVADGIADGIAEGTADSTVDGDLDLGAGSAG